MEASLLFAMPEYICSVILLSKGSQASQAKAVFYTEHQDYEMTSRHLVVDINYQRFSVTP